jgi:hypothetical protein
MTGHIPPYRLPAMNRQVHLVRRPSGSPDASVFGLASSAIPDPCAGEVLVRNLYLSADPVQRGWITNPAIQPLGATVIALGVGIVIESRIEGIAAGDAVYGRFGWQDYALAERGKVLAHIGEPKAALSAYAGALGMPGVTAWLALGDIAPPRPGQTILVSTAAGSVGSMVGQVAARAGARVIGLAGSDRKVEMCTAQFGYHAAFNYRTRDLAEVLAEAAPEGIDTFFDNTGGPILDTAIRHMKRYGRIIACGTAATPSWIPAPTGLRNEREILMRCLMWQGFVIFDHADRFDAAVKALEQLTAAENFRFAEDIDTGIERAMTALPQVLEGSNLGKKLIYIGEP